MGNLFSSSEYLQAAAAALFPGARAEIVRVGVAGRVFRLLAVDGRIRVDMPFYDFLEPEPDIVPSQPAPDTTLRYLPTVCLASEGRAEWVQRSTDRRAEGLPRVQPAPFIDWRRFPTWESFAAGGSHRNLRTLEHPGQKERCLDRQPGAVHFDFMATDHRLIDTCAAWKSAQYRRSGLADILASQRVMALFHRLLDLGILVISVLSAGGRPVAAHLGALQDGRFYSLVPAHDPVAAKCSPGTMLLERMLKASYELEHRQFDFLLGAEDYKFRYATDVRVVGELGSRPLSDVLWRRLRATLLPGVRGNARLYGALQSAKRRLLEHRWA